MPNNPPKKELEHPSHFASMLRKDNLGASTGSLRKDGTARPWGARRDSLGGSTSNLKRDFLQVPGTQLRRNSRNYSTDSLDGRRNSWDPGRRNSSGSSCGWDEPIWEEKKVNAIVRAQYQLACFYGCRISLQTNAFNFVLLIPFGCY